MILVSWGANANGQLSHGISCEQCIYPKEAVTCEGFDQVKAGTAGGSHTLVLNSYGTLYGSGSNSYGQLADCPHNTVVLRKIQSFQEFKLISVECGWDSSFAITDAGSVVAVGSNKSGQLGISKNKVVTTKHPILLEISNTVQVSAGLRHTAVVNQAGHVFVCGQSNKGQLGIVGANGMVPTNDCDAFVRVEGLEGVVQVACGQHHTLALTSDGRLLGWGSNKRGQLGSGPPLIPSPHVITCLDDNNATIATGWTHSAVLTGGRVMTWGRNTYGQLGHSNGQDQVSSPVEVAGLPSVTQLALGSEHCLALSDSGEVWSWGWNEHGNCGTGTTDNVHTPELVSVPIKADQIAAGGGHSLVFCSS